MPVTPVPTLMTEKVLLSLPRALVSVSVTLYIPSLEKAMLAEPAWSLPIASVMVAFLAVQVAVVLTGKAVPVMKGHPEV